MSTHLTSDLVVGTYSTGPSKGLYPLRFESGLWKSAEPLGHAENASYAAYSTKHDIHFILEEQDEGRVGFFRHSNDRGWSCLGRCMSGGGCPCFVDLAPDQLSLAVANYKTGSIAFYRLDEASGLAAAPAQVFQNTGSGPNSERQAGPHAHCARFHGEYVYSVDLGADTILAFPLNRSGQVVDEPFVAFKAPAGEGPRHILFHPDLSRAYLVTELGNKIFVLETGQNGRLTEVQRICTLPNDFSGKTTASHISFNARADRLYVSNRGHDSIAVFSLDSDGALSLLHVASTFGVSPRHFLLLEALDQIVVAHEKEGGVTALALEADGMPGALLQRIPIPKPCFLFEG